MSAVEPAAPPAGPLHAEKMYATPGSARYAVAPREDGLCDDKSESLFKYILSFVLDCPKLSIRFVQRFLSVNIASERGLSFPQPCPILRTTERPSFFRAPPETRV